MNILLNDLLARIQPGGGILFAPNRKIRPDATAWGAIILNQVDHEDEVISRVRDNLTTYQMDDGRVCLSPDHPNAFWPTPLSILAWQSSKAHHVHQEKAIDFLLNSTGEHWKKNPQSPLSHDPSLQGWPWIAHTHSWVESTAMAMTALHNAGHSDHPRLKEATTLLLDRQLPHGGWNYGNTMVFGQELKPSPEDTGAALSALAERVSASHVSHSLEFLRTEVKRLRTPIALGWSLLGLNAWNEMPPHALTRIDETRERGKRYGGLDTPSLCLLMAPLIAPHGLNHLLQVPNPTLFPNPAMAHM